MQVEEQGHSAEIQNVSDVKPPGIWARWKDETFDVTWCSLSNSQSHKSVSDYKRDIWSDCHALCLMECCKDFDTNHYPLFTYSRQKPAGKLSEIIHTKQLWADCIMIKISKTRPSEDIGIKYYWVLL